MVRKKTKIDDPGIVLFQGEKQFQPGQVELHSLSDLAGKLFGRKLEDVKKDWKRVSAQVKDMVESVTADVPKGFAFESLEISLGFSAEGKLVFVAEAGVEATVSLTFKRA
jgi:hypothetical protein